MNESIGYSFVAGMITMSYLISSLFFLRFWLRTKDRLFMAFAFAFGLLAANQAIVSLAGVPREDQTWFYLLRLLAFLLIIAAIVQKNVDRMPSAQRPAKGTKA